MVYTVKLTALATLAATGAFAQSSVQIDGMFNAGLASNSYKGVKVTGVEQNGAGTTQFNIRGTEDLGGGLKATFRVENDISIVRNDANQGTMTGVGNVVPQSSSTANYTAAQTTKGSVGTFANGELRVGLASANYGSVDFGAVNNGGLTNFVVVASPLTGTAINSGYGSIIGADPTMAIVRWGNSVKYATPVINGFQAQAIYAAKQTNQPNTANASGAAATTVNYGLGLNDQVGATELSAKYVNGPLTIGAVATRTDITGGAFCAAGAGTTTNPYFVGSANQPCIVGNGNQIAKGATIGAGYKAQQEGLAASYNLGSGFLLSGGYQKTALGEITAGSGDQTNRAAYIGTLQYTTGAHTLFATYGTAKEKAQNNAFNGKTSKMSGVGYNYALSKMTNFYARYEQLDDQAGLIYNSWSGAAPSGALLGMDAANNKRIRSQVGIQVGF
ncbi:porin [Limnohabitans sp. Jir72]|uniref:porin n=1 Tax=Limnohabitans sp. Jir72 TaxID=1977909 RepID=UPI001304D51C|nr:porin [Limnohabitans sp. Jir72]